ncbi:hypothetical protein M434DRAFT_86558, partial [Hypoxylon sp. CO27-5]
LAVTGLGGIGKTQLALQFAYLVKEKYSKYSVLWVPALSNETFTQAYIEIAKLLKVDNEKNEDLRLSVKRYLCSEAAGKWILIVDNADKMEVLFGSSDNLNMYLPRSNYGLTLFTTRSSEVAVAVAQHHFIELKIMSLPEAMQLFSRLVQGVSLSDEAQMRKLLEELSYLPLAISQAAAYMNQNKTRIGKYLEFLKGTERDLVGLITREFRDNTRYEGSKNAVANTWIVSFEHIRQEHPSAANMLYFLSCIEPKAIPQSILPGMETIEKEDAIGVLRGYAFLSRRGNSDIYDMHNLVHAATRVWIRSRGPVQEEEVKMNAIQRLATVFHSRDDGPRREYLPHAKRLLKTTSQYTSSIERYDLLFWVGISLYLNRRYKEALESLETVYKWGKDAIEIFERGVAAMQMRPEHDMKRLIVEHCLASAYLSTNRFRDAAKIMERVSIVEAKTLEEHDPLRVNTEWLLREAHIGEYLAQSEDSSK